MSIPALAPSSITIGADSSVSDVLRAVRCELNATKWTDALLEQWTATANGEMAYTASDLLALREKSWLALKWPVMVVDRVRAFLLSNAKNNSKPAHAPSALGSAESAAAGSPPACVSPNSESGAATPAPKSQATAENKHLPQQAPALTNRATVGASAGAPALVTPPAASFASIPSNLAAPAAAAVAPAASAPAADVESSQSRAALLEVIRLLGSDSVEQIIPTRKPALVPAGSASATAVSVASPPSAVDGADKKAAAAREAAEADAALQDVMHSVFATLGVLVQMNTITILRSAVANRDTYNQLFTQLRSAHADYVQFENKTTASVYATRNWAEFVSKRLGLLIQLIPDPTKSSPALVPAGSSGSGAAPGGQGAGALVTVKLTHKSWAMVMNMLHKQTTDVAKEFTVCIEMLTKLVGDLGRIQATGKALVAQNDALVGKLGGSVAETTFANVVDRAVAMRIHSSSSSAGIAAVTVLVLLQSYVTAKTDISEAQDAVCKISEKTSDLVNGVERTIAVLKTKEACLHEIASAAKAAATFVDSAKEQGSDPELNGCFEDPTFMLILSDTLQDAQKKYNLIQDQCTKYLSTGTLAIVRTASSTAATSTAAAPPSLPQPTPSPLPALQAPAEAPALIAASHQKVGP